MKTRSSQIVGKRAYSIFRHQKLRASESGMTLQYTVHTLRILAATQLGRPCPYCAEPIEAKTFSFDHKTPISRQGNWSTDNLVVSCLRCNRIKGNMTSDEFRRFLTVIYSFDNDITKNILSRLQAGNRFYAK